jgi:hypothetical protein
MFLLQGFLIVCDLVTAIAFLMSFKFSKENPKLTFINNFRYYFFASTCINILTYLKDGVSELLLVLIFITIEILVFSYFFYQTLESRMNRFIVKIGLLLLFIYQSLLWLKILPHQQLYGFLLIEGFYFIYLSLSYFRNLSNVEPGQNLLVQPIFWMVIGIFFLSSICTPFYATCWYFVNFNSDFAISFNKTHVKILEYLNHIPVFANLILCCFFLRAFTCKSETIR